MSFFDGFIQGAAESASGILDQQIQNDATLNRQKAIADYNEQLEEKKLRAKQQLQQELGQKINDGADLTNRQRIADKINADNGSNMTAEDATEIAKNPNAAKAYGIIDRTRAQELDDKASAADKIGAVDQAKMIRDQQNVEVQRASNERRISADEKRSELGAAQIESREKIAAATSEQRERLAMARIEALVSKQASGNKEEKVISYLEGTRKAISDEATKINQQMKADLDNVKYEPEEVKKKVRDGYKDALDGIEDKRKQLDADFKASRAKFGLAEIPSKATEKPTEDKRQPGQSEAVTLPPQAVSKLKEGTLTTFSNGQVWTMKNGKPTKVN